MRDRRRGRARTHAEVRLLESRVGNHAVEGAPGRRAPPAVEPRQRDGVGDGMEGIAPALAAGLKPLAGRHDGVGRGHDATAGS